MTSIPRVLIKVLNQARSCVDNFPNLIHMPTSITKSFIHTFAHAVITQAHHHRVGFEKTPSEFAGCGAQLRPTLTQFARLHGRSAAAAAAAAAAASSSSSATAIAAAVSTAAAAAAAAAAASAAATAPAPAARPAAAL